MSALVLGRLERCRPVAAPFCDPARKYSPALRRLHQTANLSQCSHVKLQASAPAVEQASAGGLPAPEALRPRMQLYNTMARSKQPFTPRPEHPDKVQMYVCGVTVYDYSHIGHARVYVAFDILYRFLQYLRYNVQYVRNFTDIDDKIIARATQNGEDPLALSSRFIQEFHQDMAALGCLPPSVEPKATDFIPQMISTIQRIIANGHGYAVEGGDVFFDVMSLPGYGRLSGRSQEDNRAGERVDVDGRKRHPADFALWKAAKPGEPSWESPWGRGRPGWHIECSSMIEDVMGQVIDIHGGGRDLVFPHHENELAQSLAASGAAGCGCGGAVHAHHQHAHTHEQGQELQQQQVQGGAGSAAAAASGGDFVRYWVHNGFVNVDSEKMSKSLGNFFTIREVLRQYHPLALRWFLVSTQYRQPINYTQRALEEGSDRLYYVYQALLDVEAALQAAGPQGQAARAAARTALVSGAACPSSSLLSSALSALLDDLNTPSAISELSAPLKSINDLLTTKAGKKQPDRLTLLAHHELAIAAVLQLLGLNPASSATGTASSATGGSTASTSGVLTLSEVAPPSPEALGGVLAELRRLALVRGGLSEEYVQGQIAERAAARAAKDFARADEIRVGLAAQGVLIMDTPQGTTWRPGMVSTP